MALRNLSIFSILLMISACSTNYTIPVEEINRLTGEALYQKGIDDLLGNQSKKNEKRAIAYFTAASEKQYAPAYNALGVIYDEGIAVPQNKDKAYQYYKTAADMKLAPAQYNMALFYYENDPDSPLMMDYLNAAIQQKSPDAYYLLGSLQFDQEAYRKARQNFIKAGKSGNADALFILAMMSLEGKGTAKSHQNAMKYLKQATELNHAEAQFMLGGRYLIGEQLSKNPEKAFELFTQAAKQGHVKSSVNLAIMYIRGEGTKVDTQKAMTLLKFAADHGDEQASTLLQVK